MIFVLVAIGTLVLGGLANEPFSPFCTKPSACSATVDK
jgi:hypothetical protein